MSLRDPASPHPCPWVRVALIIVAAGATGIGLGISLALGLALAGVTLVVMAGIMAWSVRDGRRRRAAGQRLDVAYLERRLLTYFRLVLLSLVGATVGVVLILASPGQHEPEWPLVLALVVTAAGLVCIWVFARVVLPRWREKQN